MLIFNLLYEKRPYLPLLYRYAPMGAEIGLEMPPTKCIIPIRKALWSGSDISAMNAYVAASQTPNPPIVNNKNDFR